VSGVLGVRVTPSFSPHAHRRQYSDNCRSNTYRSRSFPTLHRDGNNCIGGGAVSTRFADRPLQKVSYRTPYTEVAQTSIHLAFCAISIKHRPKKCCEKRCEMGGVKADKEVYEESKQAVRAPDLFTIPSAHRDDLSRPSLCRPRDCT